MRFDLNSLWNVLWLKIHMLQSTISQLKLVAACSFIVAWTHFMLETKWRVFVESLMSTSHSQLEDSVPPFDRVVRCSKIYQGKTLSINHTMKMIIDKTDQCSIWRYRLQARKGLLPVDPGFLEWWTSKTGLDRMGPSRMPKIVHLDCQKSRGSVIQLELQFRQLLEDLRVLVSFPDLWSW